MIQVVWVWGGAVLEIRKTRAEQGSSYSYHHVRTLNKAIMQIIILSVKLDGKLHEDRNYLGLTCQAGTNSQILS